MRGFCDSENPLLIDSVDSWDSRGDVSEAVDFLIANANVDSGLICIVGHSAGVNQTIRSGIYDVRIKKIIALGPSRRVAERILSAQSNERQYF